MQDSGSNTDNASVVFLSTCEKDTEEEDEIQESRNTGHSSEFHVIDGGYLPWRVIWDKISTYNEIIKKYINCGQSRYGKYVVLFDRRRLMKVVISPDVSADLESELSSTSQKVFLSNTRNKQSFIDFLVDDLKPNGHTVRQSVSDADVDILS